jgi:hypothetical protein
MQHVIIIIFDSIKYAGERVQLVDAPLRAIKFNDNFKIWYLKITTRSNEAPHDILYEVLPRTADPLSPVGSSFDFTKPASLSEAVAVIQSRQQDETSYYLISLGHGSGFGFFQRDGKTILTGSVPSVKGCSTPMAEQVSFRILGNIEFIKAFGAIKFKLAIFNNCNVTSLENCTIFSQFADYIIGTQNFLSFEMLGFKKIIKALIIAAPNMVPEEVGEYVYDRYIMNSLKVILKNDLNIDGTSLFYINLQNFDTHYTEFNKIALQLLDMAEKDVNWIIGIRKKQNETGASVSTIDLIEFLENVRLDRSATTGLKNDITDFLAAVEKSIIGKWRHKNQIRLNGIAVYFPDIDGFEYEEKYQFNRNLLCAGKFLEPSNWDKLLDKVSGSLSREN